MLLGNDLILRVICLCLLEHWNYQGVVFNALICCVTCVHYLFEEQLIFLLTFCRGQPPDYVLKEAKNVSKFFKCIGSVQNLESGEVSLGGRNAYQALTVEEYESVSVRVVVWKWKVN